MCEREGRENESEGWGSGDGWFSRGLKGISDEEKWETSTTGIGANLNPDFRDQEESNNNILTRLIMMLLNLGFWLLVGINPPHI